MIQRTPRHRLHDALFNATAPVVGVRGVHLDLKGLAPTFDRLLELLDHFSAMRLRSSTTCAIP